VTQVPRLHARVRSGFADEAAHTLSACVEPSEPLQITVRLSTPAPHDAEHVPNALSDQK
jgi:hypothetical protein